jgi:hypothetical protein
MRLLLLLLGISGLATAGCSGDGNDATGASPLDDAGVAPPPDDDGGETPGSVAPITAPPPGRWTSLIGESWRLAPGDEGYWCKRVTVAEDIWVTGFRAIAPAGTHHTTLGKDSGGPDGTFRCGGFSTGSELLFGSGVGTDETLLPTGIAVKLAAGEQILLNLHVYNTGAEPLAETSGIEILAVDPAAVEHEAAFVLAGVAGGLTVPPGESTQTGTCTPRSAVTLLSVGAHMHTKGVHQRVTAYPTADAPVVLSDAPYDFSEQTGVWLDAPFVLPAGGHVEVTCTYRNETARTLVFGEGTEDEMCYAGLYHYPRFRTGSTCVN